MRAVSAAGSVEGRRGRVRRKNRRTIHISRAYYTHLYDTFRFLIFSWCPKFTLGVRPYSKRNIPNPNHRQYARGEVAQPKRWKASREGKECVRKDRTRGCG